VLLHAQLGKPSTMPMAKVRRPEAAKATPNGTPDLVAMAVR
jgi:hypothetical protein